MSLYDDVRERIRPGESAQVAHLILLWCRWLNTSWDDLARSEQAQVLALAKRVVSDDLPALAASIFGVPR